jgi:hypothetical protein
MSRHNKNKAIDGIKRDGNRSIFITREGNNLILERPKERNRLIITYEHGINLRDRTIPKFSSIILSTHFRKDKNGKEKEYRKLKVVGVNSVRITVDNRIESFKNIKSIEAAKRIISKRGTSVVKAVYNGEVL